MAGELRETIMNREALIKELERQYRKYSRLLAKPSKSGESVVLYSLYFGKQQAYRHALSLIKKGQF